ncbi:MAG: hypothetical protein LDL24_09670 [Treponema sp.]|nr:hypothetical protein [Treponema sp.]
MEMRKIDLEELEVIEESTDNAWGVVCGIACSGYGCGLWCNGNWCW